MELLIIRHGIAEERESFFKKGLEDHFRPLTLKGRKRMQKVAVALQDHIGEIDLIVSSPLTRARQTAEILSQIFFDAKVIEAPELSPQSPPQALVKWLRLQTGRAKRVAVVGHEPHLSSFASYLLTGKAESFLDLRKSGVMALELESFSDVQAGQAQLLYSLPPRFLID